MCLVLAFALAPVRADEETPEEALQRAEKLEQEGSLTQAQSIYEEFLRKNPGHIRQWDIRYRLALCLDNMNDPDKAMARLQEVLDGSKGTMFKHRFVASTWLAASRELVQQP